MIGHKMSINLQRRAQWRCIAGCQPCARQLALKSRARHGQYATVSHPCKFLKLRAISASREPGTRREAQANDGLLPSPLADHSCSNALPGAAHIAAALAFLLAGNLMVAHADEAVATSGAALELQQAYDKFSFNYDDLDGGAAAEAFGFPQLRQKLLEQARGSVLEVAVGTGLNLPYYRWVTAAAAESQAASQQQQLAAAEGASVVSRSNAAASGDSGVTSLSTVDLSPGMLLQARRRVADTPALAERPISFREADVAALPFPDSSFDSVVDTFSLCVFPDPQAALSEIARVVRPASSGGRVLLLEHCRSDNPLLAAYQDATAGPVAALGKGCLWNQDVEALAGRAGLRVVAVERAAGGTVELLMAVK